MKIKIRTFAIQSGGVAIISALLCLSFSCHHSGSSSNTSDTATTSPVATLKNKINTIHEQAMDKIGPLRKLKDSIRNKIKITAKQGKDTSRLSQVANALNTNDTAMFGWMRQYDMHLNGKSDSAKVQYLQFQLQKLTQLNNSMDSAMVHAGEQLK